MTDFARLRRIRNQEDFEAVKAIATLEKHDLIAPTHVIEKNGDYAGYFSIGNIPIVIGCLSPRFLQARDSFNLIHIAEQVVENGGFSSVMFPVGQESPIHKYMEGLGFRKLATVDLFAKEFVR